MRRAKRITALAVAAAMVFSNVAYAAPGTDTTTTQAGAESAESLNSQSDASGGIEGQASDQTGNGTDSSAQAEQQTETKKTDTQNTTTDAGSQTEAQTTQEEAAKEETTKDETSSQTPSTDTQTQETPSTEAEAQKAEEKQEASQTEEEKVLYDITFETPEKHGKVTDMDGNEVADGKTLKTDENGKVQFKVKADDGYQVSAVYQMPDEKTPLKLMKDSYYELQVDKNTTVKVVYQKIPEANEDGEDADSKAEEQEATQTPDSVNNQESSGLKTQQEEKASSYDVAFETEEDHGKILDVNGNEIASGTTLKTDENGVAKFIVQADDGYKVKNVYQMPEEKSLTLQAESYYQIQVTENTTVKVVYQKIENENKTEKKTSTLSDDNAYEVYVGKTITIQGNSVTFNRKHEWSVAAEDKEYVTLSNTTERTVQIKGLKAKESILVTHKYQGYIGEEQTEEFYVSVKDLKLESIRISGNQSMVIGSTQILSAVLSPEEYEEAVNLQWNSSNPEVATVNEEGTVTAKGLGTTTITASANGVTSNEFQITVTNPILAESVIITSEFERIYVGGNKTMTAYVSPSTTTDKTLTWSVDNSYYATIDEKTGTITGRHEGKVTVTVTTANGKTAQKEIRVEEARHTENVYFYGVRQGSNPLSLESEDYFYIGQGKINTDGLNVPTGSYELYNVNDYIVSSPDDTTIKEAVAKYYNVSDPNDVNITYTFYKITHPYGWTDSEGKPHDNGKLCYHVDMDISVETLDQASATFHLKDAGETSFETQESFMVDKGDNVSPEKNYPEEKVVDGVTYYFDGWYTNDACMGTKVEFPYTVNGAVRFYAQYVAQRYTLQYDANGGSGTPPQGGQYASGTEVTVASGEGLSKSGYTFKGWNTKADGSGTPYQPGDTLLFTNTDVTLYAVWERDVSDFSVTGIDTTYDGQSHQVALLGTLLDGEKWQYKDGDSWIDVPESGLSFTDSVDKTLELRVITNDQNAIWNGTAQVTIAKRELKIHKESSAYYNGETQVMNISEGDLAEGTVASGEKLTVKAGISGKEAGTYTTLDEGATWSVFKDELDVSKNYDVKISGSFTIKKSGSEGDKDPYTGSVTLDDWTYGDEAKEEKAETTGGDYSDPTYYYKEAKAGDETYTKTKPTEAGDYIVKAVWEETANCVEITATDPFTIAKRTVIITTESASKTYDGSELTALGKVEGIVDGETYGFTVTGSQTWVGSSDNTYVMTWAGSENTYTAKENNYTVTPEIGTLTVTDGSGEDPIDPEDVVKKTHGEPDDGIYEAGDVVTFTVTVTNIYDQTKTITLNEIDGVTLEQSVFEGVEPGKTVSTTATYTITEKDILAGEFVNTVTASFSDEETKFEDEDTVDKIEDPAGHLKIEKVTTSDPGEDQVYSLGDVITYKITATNDGNLTLTDVVVTDELTDDEWTIETLAPGESKEFTAEYTVTEEDILAGTVVNTATAEGTSPDPDEPEVPVTPGEKEDPTDTKKPSLFVEKTAQPDEDGVYNLGDEIVYTIKVVNNGNVTVTNIDVADDLTGGAWTIDSLAPGESEEFTTTYTVTEDDILNGSITNVATAEGTDPKDDPVDTDGEETVPTDPADSRLTVNKKTTSNPGEDGTYGLGDTITYEIVATNAGNLTLNNVVVTDKLTGDEWTIETLTPGASETMEASYVVTEEDIHNGSVINEATATADGKEEEDPEIIPGETEDKTDPENPDLSISKSVVEPKEEYQIGDTIQYQITVSNAGNVTQDDILVTDMLNAAGDIVIKDINGAEGEVDGENVTLDSLAPGETATIDCEYTVLKEDRGNTITNVAVADDKDGEDPQTPEVPAEVADVYDISVVHQFADGEEGDVELPNDYTVENVAVGTERTFTAESVDGYTAYPATQSVTVEDRDITVTFVYYKDEIGTDPEDPDKPDEVPDKYQVTVSYEAVNGTVDKDTAVVTLMDEAGNPAENGTGYLAEEQIATATAANGFDQATLTWTPEAPTAKVAITKDMTFTATFSERSDLHYEVHYFYDGEEAEDQAVSKDDGVFGAKIPYTAEDTTEYNGHHYVLERVEGGNKTITTDAADNVVNVYYVLDEKGTDPENPDNPDEVPDKYQVTVSYEAVNGRVNKDSAVVTLMDEAGNPAEDGTGYLTENQIATATANDGYAQGSLTWTPETPTEKVAITKDMTFTASFDRRSDLHYEVHYFYGDVEAEDQAVVSDEGVYEAAIPYTTESPVEYNGHNYVFDRVEGAGKTISTNAEDNVVNVYYALDEKGIDPEDPDNPDNPDGTADKYQVAFTYVAGAHGSVDGTLAEVVTRPDNSTEAPVKAAAEVTATPDSGYHFVDWTTQDGQHFASVEDIRAAEFGKDTVFTANFAEDGNVVINYAATEGGSVNPVNESLAPATGNAAGSTATAADGYRFVNWTDAEGNVVSTDAHFAPAKVNGLNVAATYTAHFERRTDLHYEVHYFYDGTEAEDQAVVNNNATFGAEIPYTDTASVTYNGQNYVLDRVEGAGNTVTTDADANVVNVYYTMDEVGTDPENPDNPDNVPDRYQAVVTFEAVNGTVDRSTAVVTLMRDGEPAEDGTGYLTEDQIATATANAGYDQNSLTWSSETPTIEVPITGDRTFTATFAATQTPVIPEEPEEPTTPTVPTLPTTPTTPGTPTTPTLPVTPANPGTPATPALPGAPAAAGTTAPIVYADGVVVDDAEPAEDDYNLNEVERDGDTETIDEDATPLGNMDLDKDDDHKCCILHFILLLLALIVELIYTHDRKKRQERIFELRRELEDIDDEELQADR